MAWQPPLIDWEREIENLAYLLMPEVLAAAQIGGTATLLQLAAKGFPVMSVDWAALNETAATWAESYVMQLAGEVTQTTRDQLTQAIATFHRTPGMTRAQLEQLILRGPDGIPDLVSHGRFYPATQRAEWIAVTETTRSYTEGNIAAMEALGVEQVKPREKPPKHVGCRCDITAAPRADGTMTWFWNSLNDDLVCDQCSPLNGKDVGEHA